MFDIFKKIDVLFSYVLAFQNNIKNKRVGINVRINYNKLKNLL
jgi:hypothetical protein